MIENQKVKRLEKRQARKRLKKLKDLDADITWKAFFETIDKFTLAKIKGNYLIPYARYLEEKLRDLLPKIQAKDAERRRLEEKLHKKRRPKRVLKVYERIDNKVDINYVCTLERRLRDFYTKIRALKSINEKLRIKTQEKHHVEPLFNIFDQWKNRKSSSLKPTLEKKLNEYITLRMEHGKTFIYVNEKRFIQCIRLVLNIPIKSIEDYDEITSIDEAADVNKNKTIWQNRIVRGPGARPDPFQSHDIKPEQEFWGHCSNIQTWIEHNYDTRILMSNISFPLLRTLSDAGDPTAKRVFKEEIALRLESGYPSVVQYLINQGYIKYFTPAEFKTILESTNLIENISSQSRVLMRFLKSCTTTFPESLGDILLEILKLPEGKAKLISSVSLTPISYRVSLYNRINPLFLSKIKYELEELLLWIDDDNMHDDIVECMHAIEKSIEGMNQDPTLYSGSRANLLMELLENPNFANLDDLNNPNMVENINHMKDAFGQMLMLQSKCQYCGKIIPKGQDTCDWCGHKKDDDEDGFFPYPFILKPPGGGGGGGGVNKNLIAIPLKT
ncbi:hypothetical protein LCGC14_1034420 [marine sediment metagenome]|uniref:Uncharacterized protein n=1 Tax=marine sediment metagenome TaxID=412755 RepID=A0A0F9NF97_9ZZZZ